MVVIRPLPEMFCISLSGEGEYQFSNYIRTMATEIIITNLRNISVPLKLNDNFVNGQNAIAGGGTQYLFFCLFYVKN